MSTAIVVGAGPNGLAAAVTLAQAGVTVTVLEAADEIGGGTRSGEVILPGLCHDHCSAFHPVAAGSPFILAAGLTRYGLEWRWPEIDCAHPLDDGTAATLYRGIDRTAAGLGNDGGRWRLLFGRPAEGFDELAADITGPLLRLPRHPIQLARFGIPAALPGSVLARLFTTKAARALFGGVAAHMFRPLHLPFSAAVGMGIITAGHRHGWPVAAGGSRAITDAMAALLQELGGIIETGVPVLRFADLPTADVTLFDLAPSAVADILIGRQPSRLEQAYRRFRHAPGTFKVDFAVQGGVPWRAREARRAGTVHLGGCFAEIAATERIVSAGRMPDRPFVLVGQQYLADPARSTHDVHPVWTYAHVPAGYEGDATPLIMAQIERFAPGFRERVIGLAVRSTTEMSRYNRNYVGGDIIGGRKDVRQLVLGPGAGWHPYETGVRGMYLCSASTPPGPGAHGMCGFHAAQAALRQLVVPSALWG
ncbi:MULTISPECIES: phytoene desaturase family protein [Amycolatopsis]|uniref:phytoene desaturase family protein n=1 Tax=Amycolatopsis TaxID=1813 RepID=UPI000B8B0C03|nr:MULTISPECIES: NAD(P)/FAD-dependent oxidoreductase [Amycolatopsis]OXM72795.1 FAD-dependent oxidoreductase [Amycolatopsis sp. KNN50.9b]